MKERGGDGGEGRRWRRGERRRGEGRGGERRGVEGEWKSWRVSGEGERKARQ